jgi:GNAT superfamily N-acetyltransferase
MSWASKKTNGEQKAMRYEPIKPGSIPELMRLWNEEWGESLPMREKILEQNVLSDPNVAEAGTWLAIDESAGQAVGYVVTKVWQDQASGLEFGRDDGYLHTLLVAPAYRRRGIGTELLARAEAALRDQGTKRVHVGNDFHLRIVPGVPAPSLITSNWLMKRGYEQQAVVYDLFNDTADEAEHNPQELPRFEGVTFRMLKGEEANKLISFLRRCFPGRWEYQTLDYWKRGGTGREFIICEKGQEIIGFCRINDAHSPLLAQNIYWSELFEQELGGIGPLGIDERFRGYGYGLAIVKAGIHFLQKRGIHKSVIDTTPYADFYGKLGYTIWRTYTRYRKCW